MAACPPVVEYSREFQARAAEERALLPEGSAVAEMLADYAVLRDHGRALAEIAATNAKLDALGLVLDSDPRRVTKTGSAQTSDPAADADNDPAQAGQQD